MVVTLNILQVNNINMPKFVKSGKYYYKINKTSGKKTRISKEDFIKYSKKNIKLKVSNSTNSTKSFEEILHNTLKKIIEKVKKEKLIHSMVNIERDIIIHNNKYRVFIKIGKCPLSNYYIYKVIAKNISNNQNNNIIFQRSIVSSEPILF